MALCRPLLAILDDLADELVGRITGAEEIYAARETVSSTDLRQSCRRNVEGVIVVLAATVEPGVDPLDAPRETGRRRARQGVPLESVLHAYRIGGHVLWDRLVHATRSTPEDPQNLGLLAAAGRVWEVVDQHSTALASEYRREEAYLSNQDHRKRQSMLAALMDESRHSEALIAEATSILDAGGGVAMVCAVALVDDPLRSGSTLAEILEARSVASTWVAEAGLEIGLVKLGTYGLEDLEQSLGSGSHDRIGLSPLIYALDELPRARRLALLAARSLPPGQPGAASLESRIPQALLQVGRELIPMLLEQTAQPLLSRGSAGGTLLQTVRAYLETSGSISRSAAQLYCHRNTVDYRLSRVALLCQRGLDTAEDQLHWRLALCAIDHQNRLS